MEMAEHREPYEPRGSRTVLGERGGEIPPRHSTPCDVSWAYVKGPLSGVKVKLSWLFNDVTSDLIGSNLTKRFVLTELMQALRRELPWQCSISAVDLAYAKISQTNIPHLCFYR
jgi:hypothetical protein